MEDKDMTELLEITKIHACKYKIEARLKGIVRPGCQFQYVYAAYLCKRKNITSPAQFQNYVNEMDEGRKLFLSNVDYEDWETIENLGGEFGAKLLSEYLIRYWVPLPDDFFNVTESIGKLALRLLDITESDHVADFGCGYNNFLMTINTESAPSGVVNSKDAKEMVLIKNELCGRNVEVVNSNLFKLDQSYRFDKILAESPIGTRPLKSNAATVGFDKIMQSVPGMDKAVSYSWLVAASVVEHLNKNGRAVLLVPLGSLSNTMEGEVRKNFIEQTQAVIALGSRLLLNTQVPMAFIILGKNNTGTIRMIDARKLLVDARRLSVLLDSQIDTIVNALEQDSDITVDVSIKELAENNYSFNPVIYFNKVSINNGVQLKDVTKRIIRGMPLSAGKLDGLVSDTPTGLQYLQLSDIQDGMIRSDLSYLKSMDKEYKNYTIKRDCIILSRTGSPEFKMAVAEFETDAKVIGSGNLYIIEMDQEKMNPYFLKAFLESRDGQLSLKRISAGSVLENISIRALKTLEVPCPAMSEQNRIAEKYKKKEDAVRALSKKLDEAKQALKNVYKGGEK